MHWFIGDWSMDGNAYKIDVQILFNYIKINKALPNEMDFAEIAFRSDVDKKFYRYEFANTKYPMIISQMVNPLNKKYRLIDGRHRINKLMNEGKTRGLFYEIPKEFIFKNMIKQQ